MTRTTKAQRAALKRLYDRYEMDKRAVNAPPVSYRQFRKYAQPAFGLDGVIMIHLWNMWIGIEPDGYTHS